jgi:hypothetical protein
MNTDLPIKIPKCTLTRVGAELPTSLPITEWLDIGKQLFAVGSCYQFLLGDWLNYGEREYGEKYAEACKATELDYQTLARYCQVCSKIEITRRRVNLSFGHHVEVQPLSRKEQDKWLELAEENKWSVAELREQLRDDGAEYANEDHGKPIKTFASHASSLGRIINQNGDSMTLWSQDERDRTAELLRPIVDFYARLRALEGVGA